MKRLNKEFIEVWQKAKSIDDVLKYFKSDVRTMKQKAQRYRRHGIKLKVFPENKRLKTVFTKEFLYFCEKCLKINDAWLKKHGGTYAYIPLLIGSGHKLSSDERTRLMLLIDLGESIGKISKELRISQRTIVYYRDKYRFRTFSQLIEMAKNAILKYNLFDIGLKYAKMAKKQAKTKEQQVSATQIILFARTEKRKRK